jgi:hypothetical protein
LEIIARGAEEKVIRPITQIWPVMRMEKQNQKHPQAAARRSTWK